jgi:hypothetical protein
VSSFNGCTFKERGQMPTYPLWPAQSIISEKDRPAGRLAIIQEIGADIERFGLVVRVSKAELLALYDQVLNEGTLIFSYETCTALLCGVTDASEQGAASDKYFATLDLIKLDDSGGPDDSILLENGDTLLAQDGSIFVTE